MQEVKDIRNKFADLFNSNKFVIDKNGGKVVELIGESFIANEGFIFGEPNFNYIEREILWYKSKSLNVNDIPGETPKIWKSVADKDGFINSNYGWMIYSNENYLQYDNVLNELLNNNFSRRASMIYQRPSMWKDYNKDGKNDFCCTYGVQFFIRENELIAYVIMRSNDSFYGYRNDYHWHLFVIKNLFNDLKDKGIELNNYKILWTSASLHLYESQFYLLKHYINTGETNITLNEFNLLYK